MPTTQVPWLRPLGVPERELDALLFRTMLVMRVPPVGRALDHYLRAYPLTSALLDPQFGALAPGG